MICRCLVLAALVASLAPATAGAAIIRVRDGGDLQAAINAAQPGDVILLEPGATYIGNFTLPAKPGASDITIRSAAPDSALPDATRRMTPAHAGLLPKIKSGNAMSALATDPGAHHWRLMFLEFQGNTGGFGDIIQLGDGNETSAARVPHHLTIDRCYIHGDADAGQKRGIALNSASTDILNSSIADIKAAGQESHGIGGWNGPGPYVIENNFIQAAGVNVMFGGADPKIRDLVPADIVFRRNHVIKDPSWRGSKWTVKNLFELKNARGVVVEENLFENNWLAAQVGYAIVFTPRNQDGSAPWCTVEDVSFRFNVVRHSSAGVNILGRDNNPSGQARRIAIVHNLFYDIDAGRWGGNGVFLQIGDAPATVAVIHNTIAQSGNLITAYGGSDKEPAPIAGFVFRDNLARHNEYGIFGVGRAFGSDAINAYFPESDVRRNVLAGGVAARYPRDNFFPSGGDFDRFFVSMTDGNFHLTAGSAYQASASDGTAVGVDASRLTAAFKTPEGVSTGRKSNRPIEQDND